MQSKSILPLPICMNVLKNRINHYTLPLPHVEMAEKVQSQEVAKAKQIIRKAIKGENSPKMRSDLAQDTFEKVVSAPASVPVKKEKHVSRLAGDKNAMASYFDNSKLVDAEVAEKEQLHAQTAKEQWYAQVAKELETADLKKTEQQKVELEKLYKNNM